MIFLIEYCRERGVIETYQEFDDDRMKEAHAVRLELEKKRDLENIQNEIVILKAKDKDALRQTHNRYFATLEELLNPPTEQSA